MPASRPGATIDHLALLAALQASFLDAIPTVDEHAPVPGCDPWTVRDLVEHVADVHRWAAAEAGRTDEVPLDPPPTSLTDLYGRSAAELRATLALLGPDAPARTLVGDGPASFWWRRQAHETLVHRWDLHTAGAPAPGPTTVLVDLTPVWADAVDEVVTVMHPRQVRLGRATAPARAVALVADDAARGWVVGPGDPVARVVGPAREVALRLWRRTGDDSPALRVEGDPTAWRALLAQPVTP